jgi:hypothetical protein
LLARIRQRLYAETMPGLISFWPKSVRLSGYSRRRWKELNHLFRLALKEQVLDEPSRQVLNEIRNQLTEMVRMGGRRKESVPRRIEPVRARLNPEGLAVYAARLLNEWMPVEVARTLLDENESAAHEESGIPVLTIGSAIERLLLREHLSSETMEMLLEPELLSPEHVYPADLELLRDVVLSLLGRTSAPTLSVLPATLLFVAPDSHLAPNYREALRHAQVVQRPGGEEIHVPIAPAWAFEMVKEEQVRIGSIIVTMDGRWWESEHLEFGERHFIVYRPGRRLRIEYSAGFAELRAPWPENRLRWAGGCIGRTAKIFGREWRASKWEVDAERTWLHLVLSRPLPTSEIVPGSEGGPWRLPPASVDMAWAALASALRSSRDRKSNEAIEQLRHSDLIPLGRAIARLAETVVSRQRQIDSMVEAHLASIRYAEGYVFSTYGRVPWKILPEPVRRALLGIRPKPVFLGLLNDIFEGLPEALYRPTAQSLTPPCSIPSPNAA